MAPVGFEPTPLANLNPTPWTNSAKGPFAAADGGDVELQREARDAQAVPAGEGFDDDDGDCLRGKVYADLCSKRKLGKGSGGVGAQPPRKL